jgi:hypothetical protein
VTDETANRVREAGREAIAFGDDAAGLPLSQLRGDPSRLVAGCAESSLPCAGVAGKAVETTVPAMLHGASIHFDLIGRDRLIRGAHDGMLGQLLGVKGMGVAPQDEAAVVRRQAETANAAVQLALKMGFQFPQRNCPLGFEIAAANVCVHV